MSEILIYLIFQTLWTQVVFFFFSFKGLAIHPHFNCAQLIQKKKFTSSRIWRVIIVEGISPPRVKTDGETCLTAVLKVDCVSSQTCQKDWNGNTSRNLIRNVSAEGYCTILTKVRKTIWCNSPGIIRDGVIILYDTYRSHTAGQTSITPSNVQVAGYFSVTLLPSIKYLAPSDYFPFSKLKKHSSSTRFSYQAVMWKQLPRPGSMGMAATWFIQNRLKQVGSYVQINA